MLSKNSDLAPSIQVFSTQPNARVVQDTLESDLNVPQNGALPVKSFLCLAPVNGLDTIASESIGTNIAGVSSQANAIVSTVLQDRT